MDEEPELQKEKLSPEITKNFSEGDFAAIENVQTKREAAHFLSESFMKIINSWD